MSDLPDWLPTSTSIIPLVGGTFNTGGVGVPTGTVLATLALPSGTIGLQETGGNLPVNVVGVTTGTVYGTLPAAGQSGTPTTLYFTPAGDVQVNLVQQGTAPTARSTTVTALVGGVAPYPLPLRSSRGVWWGSGVLSSTAVTQLIASIPTNTRLSAVHFSLLVVNPTTQVCALTLTGLQSGVAYTVAQVSLVALTGNVVRDATMSPAEPLDLSALFPNDTAVKATVNATTGTAVAAVTLYGE